MKTRKRFSLERLKQVSEQARVVVDRLSHSGMSDYEILQTLKRKKS